MKVSQVRFDPLSDLCNAYIMRTLKKCRAEFLQIGDVLIFNYERWAVSQIEDDAYCREIRLKNSFGDGKIKFMSPDEVVSIEFWLSSRSMEFPYLKDPCAISDKAGWFTPNPKSLKSGES